MEDVLKNDEAETLAIATRKAVAIEGLSKSFGATKALDDVSFDVDAGQIRGLIGENGAGKSTLLKLVSGLVKPDRGAMAVFGSAYQPRTPLDAQAFGVQTVFQELTLVEDLTVMQNLLLPNEPRGAFGLISGRASREKAAGILARFRVSDIDPDAEIRDLSLSDRQRIEIVRAVSRNPRLLLLDEATSALTSKDVGWLYSLVTDLRSDSVGIIFISHRIAEIRDLCATISVLRNGRHVVTDETASLSDADIVRLVIGRSLAKAFPPKPALEEVGKPSAGTATARPVLSGRNLCAGAHLTDASFDLFPGQILGVAALDGMGQADLFSALFGASLLKSGAVRVEDRPVSLSTPRDAIRAGVGYVPSDRRREGVALSLSGTMNMAMPFLEAYTPFGWIDTPRLKHDIEGFLARLEIHPRALYRSAGSFSGGNQQKIVIAKWLMAKLPVLLMNDPTRGVDVGTKFEIFSIMRAFVSAGGAILFYSTELTELVNMCDRVSVLYRGRFVRTFEQKEVSEETLMQSVLGRDGHGAEVGV